MALTGTGAVDGATETLGGGTYTYDAPNNRYLIQPVSATGGSGGNSPPSRLANGLAFMGTSLSSEGITEKFSWPFKLCFFSNQKYRLRGNFAVGGSTAANLRDLQLQQVLALQPPPRACVIECGSNDVSAGNAGVDAGIAIVLAMALQLDAAGITPVLWTVPPRGEVSASLAQVDRWNFAIRKMLAIYNWPVADGEAAMRDPAAYSIRTTVPPLTYDGTRPTAFGCATYAQYILGSIGFSNVPSDTPVPLVSGEFDSYNLVPCGTFAEAGTDGPGIASGWYSYGTAGASLVAGAPQGKWQRITRPAGAVPLNGSIGWDTPLVTPGHTLEIMFRLQVQKPAAQVNLYGSLLAYQFKDATDVSIGYTILAGKPGLAFESGVVRALVLVPAAAKKFQLLFSQIEGTDTPTEDTWYQFGQLSTRDVT